MNRLKNNFFTSNNNRKVKIKSIEVEHGKVKSNCFIIDNKLAYISDVSKIYNKDLQDTFKSLPLEKMLIETDSPFLAPIPNRGKKNEPSFIDFTAAKLSEIKEISKSKLVEITTNNFNKLFFN